MFWVRAGSVMMFLGVSMGAFAAHLLKSKLTEQSLEIFKTGVFYHLIHALALFGIAWLVSKPDGPPKAHLAGCFLLVGIILFSGSLYALSMSRMTWLGMITPLGGLAFLVGWFLLLL